MQDRKIFLCSFDSRYYPFGRVSTCKINFYIEGITNILTDLSPTFVNRGQDTFGHFVIDNWRVRRTEDDNNGKMIEISMTLRRDMRSIFTVIFLPTILMNIINQASNYITGPDRYNMIYTINITCMMVLASIYLSVSSSLPSTASIKPVEVWLLVNLFYPLQVILTNVILQVSFNDTFIKLSLILSGIGDENIKHG